ncbi:MAG: RNA-binding RNA processing protein rpp1 [Sporothrix thermara]
MLHDLSLVWTPSTTPTELANTLALSAELGYDVVALDQVYQGTIPSTITSPLGDAVTAASSTLKPPARRTPRILHRATVVVSDLTVNHRLSAFSSAYDLVAVRPTTEKAFQAACLSMAEPALISLDLTTYFPFYFKHRACMAAVRRGVHFEVCYGQALRAGDSTSTGADAKSGSAARARALFIANLAGLVRATRGRGIVVSSGARAALDLRGPADVVNLLAVWGLAPDRGSEGMAALPRSIVANESLRRRGFRGVVDIVQTAGGADGGKSKAGEGKQQKQQQKNNAQRKRKADDGLGSGPQAKHQQMKKQKKGGA